MKQSKGKLPYKTAISIAKKIISYLEPHIIKISEAGSLKRKKPMVRDIDILAASNKPEKVIATFIKYKEIKKVLAKGPTKATVILKNNIQVDLRVLPPKSWGAGLLYFTGGKNYNIELRKIAIKKGFKLSEYGLYGKKTGKLIASKTEQEILKKLGVKYKKPEER